MAWVRTFDEDEATGRLAEVYRELKEVPPLRRARPKHPWLTAWASSSMPAGATG